MDNSDINKKNILVKILDGLISRVRRGLNPTQTLVFGFLIIIAIGGVLLSMPAAAADGKSTPLLDCMFTSASATCVTGLTVVNTAEHWSLFGKIVILLLIQVGGLGFVTLMTTILVIAGRRITLRERIILQESLNLSKKNGLIRFVKFLAKFTLAIELFGAIILTLCFLPDYGLTKSIGMGIFHSVSAFCNAGFDIIGDSSLIPYAENTVVNVVIILLVVTGGLGFPVWVELLDLAKNVKGNKFSLRHQFKKLSLHTKLVLVSTATLLSLGTVLTLLFEFNNPATMGNYSLKGKLLASLFHSVVLRTAGFVSIPYSGLYDSTKFFSIILMMIGGSPCGTAGGIKTVSVTVILLAVISLVKDRENIYAFKRNISLKTLQKALAVIIMMLGLLILSTLLLSVTELNLKGEFEFIDLLFETASALGTVGSTIGITPQLSYAGKLIIMVCMFIGRLGPITIAISFTSSNKDKSKVHYPSEDILVG
jgi:trk system potassium uptake protein TrkH